MPTEPKPGPTLADYGRASMEIFKVIRRSMVSLDDFKRGADLIRNSGFSIPDRFPGDPLPKPFVDPQHGFTLADMERIENPWKGLALDGETGEYRPMTLTDLDRAIDDMDADG